VNASSIVPLSTSARTNSIPNVAAAGGIGAWPRIASQNGPDRSLTRRLLTFDTSTRDPTPVSRVDYLDDQRESLRKRPRPTRIGCRVAHGGFVTTTVEGSSRDRMSEGTRVMITAFVLIEASAERIPEAAQAIADIDGVAEVYSCAGDVDLIAVVRAAAHEDLAELIPGKISKVDGVISTDTHIAFRSYARRDTEAAFAIGADGTD